jgi:hypothetical protein
MGSRARVVPRTKVRANYLLHHRNEPISAFDLEVAVAPEKGPAGQGVRPEILHSKPRPRGKAKIGKAGSRN